MTVHEKTFPSNCFRCEGNGSGSNRLGTVGSSVYLFKKKKAHMHICIYVFQKFNDAQHILQGPMESQVLPSQGNKGH